MNDSKLTTPRYVLYRKKAAIVRSQNIEDAKELLEILTKIKGNFRQGLRESGYKDGAIREPTLHISHRMNLNRAYRGIAKIAFNMLAHVVGSEAMQHSSLNLIRNYILGTDVRISERTASNEIFLDKRFVTWHHEPEARNFIKSQDTHQIMLFVGEESTYARIVLYETQTFFVNFQTLGVAPPHHYPVFEFSANRLSHREVSLEELLRRMPKEDIKRLMTSRTKL